MERKTFYLEKDYNLGKEAYEWVVDMEDGTFKKRFDTYEGGVYYCKHQLGKELGITYYEVYDIDNAGLALFEEDGTIWASSQYGGQDTEYIIETWVNGCPERK